jgi:hypothetical protein
VFRGAEVSGRDISFSAGCLFKFQLEKNMKFHIGAGVKNKKIRL